MSDNSWAYDIGTVVFSIVKTKAKPKLEPKYPTIYFTSNGKKLSDAIFPTVYIHRMAAAERGTDLEGLSITQHWKPSKLMYLQTQANRM